MYQKFLINLVIIIIIIIIIINLQDVFITVLLYEHTALCHLQIYGSHSSF